MNALNRYNAITLSLEADNNDDEAVSMTLDLDAPVDPRYREQDETFSAIYELLKHNRELANHIDQGTGRHILSFVVNSRMGQLLINSGANRNHIDINARMPLSYVENIELHRELMRFNRPRPSRVNNQKVSNSVRK